MAFGISFLHFIKRILSIYNNITDERIVRYNK